MARMRRALAAIAITLLTAGCSSTASVSNRAPSTTPPPSSPTSASSPTPTPEPSRSPFSIGSTWTWETDSHVSGNTTVESYQQDVAPDAPTPERAFGSGSHGYVWAALKVKVCSDATSAKTITVSNMPWKLAYDDGTMVEASSDGYDQFPQPKFPFGDTEMAPGRCVAGNIVFPVPGDKRPARVVYAPAGLQTPVEWTVPAS